MKQAVDDGTNQCRGFQHDWAYDGCWVNGEWVHGYWVGDTHFVHDYHTDGASCITYWKCKRCGMLRREESGNYMYDDYYMYGGGYMMGYPLVGSYDSMGFGTMGLGLGLGLACTTAEQEFAHYEYHGETPWVIEGSGEDVELAHVDYDDYDHMDVDIEFDDEVVLFG